MDSELKKQITFIVLIVIMLILMFLNYHTEAKSTTYGHFKVNLISVHSSQRKPVKSEDLGLYTITAYCSCIKCCGKDDGITASGIKATEGRTVAADLPFGTVLEIEGIGSRVVEDRGVLGKHIDIFINDHNRCIEFGRKQSRVFKTN